MDIMDKSWIHDSRVSRTFKEGVTQFLNFAFHNAAFNGTISCPCKNCNNVNYHDRKTVEEHMICDGIDVGYLSNTWVYHGELELGDASMNNEEQNQLDDMQGMLRDAFGIPDVEEDRNDGGDRNNGVGDMIDEVYEAPNDDAQSFYNLLKDAQQPLYPGCKTFTKLSFIVRIFHTKCLYGWSDKSVTVLLQILKEAFPDGETLPKSFYQTKKIITDLGLGYKKIDACPNDCMLFWKEKAEDSECSICGASRWKTIVDDSNYSSSKDRKTPAKILRHFPLKPRLQRYFMSKKTSAFMKWHEIDRIKDGKLRHPADSEAWKKFDERYPDFALDPRNVRLGLASDGFNPFSIMSVAHSTWPVVLMIYNLPPWMCMKQANFIMSLLISGPHAPGNDIDVYLQPLIDELKELWVDGVDTFDASMKQNFKMRATLLWTVSDFPAYANLSGWSTKGRFACPYCNKNTIYRRLKYWSKFCYMGHQRFLDGNAPTPPTGSKILEEQNLVKFTYGKHNLSTTGTKRKRDDGNDITWKKKSIFFQLPYWEHNLVRHNLDVMHIEKNICDSIIGTLLDIEGKTKDNLKSRLDMKDMGIRPALHPRVVGAKTILPSACFSMTRVEKEIFCKVLAHVKVPDGYSSNISRCVQLKERKIQGLKSHDCHILMQQLLPLAVRKTLPKKVSSVLVELSNFFRELCTKTGTVEEFAHLQSRIALVLCRLEKIFPPSFFDIMIHLPIHLANEARLAGPVHYRWMYPVERYLRTLKSYVRNKCYPEGSIAEGYLADECLTFCSQYLFGVETKINRLSRNDDNNDEDDVDGKRLSVFLMKGRGIGKEETILLDEDVLTQAHRYILFNCEEVFPFIEQHLNIVRRSNRRARPIDINRFHSEGFPKWFEAKVLELYGKDDRVTEDLKWLAQGPNRMASRFKKYIINGSRFKIKTIDKFSKTQNSGIVVTATTSSFSSPKDKNPISANVSYFGQVTGIIELDYYVARVALFKCDWVDITNNRGIKKDELGFTLVKLSCLLNSDEPYVIASQASQVFYVKDPIDMNWHVAILTKPRDLYDIDGNNDNEGALLVDNDSYGRQSLEEINDNNDDVNLVREDVPGKQIDIPSNVIEGEQDSSEDYDINDNSDNDN